MHFISKSDSTDVAAASDHIVALRERKENLESAADEARAVLAEPRQYIDSADTIAAFAQEMSEFLTTSELTETKAFVHSFVKEIRVKPGRAAIIYSMPTPDDSPLREADSAEIAIYGGVRKSVHHGGRNATVPWSSRPASGPNPLHSTMQSIRILANLPSRVVQQDEAHRGSLPLTLRMLHDFDSCIWLVVSKQPLVQSSQRLGNPGMLGAMVSGPAQRPPGAAVVCVETPLGCMGPLKPETRRYGRLYRLPSPPHGSEGVQPQHGQCDSAPPLASIRPQHRA